MEKIKTNNVDYYIPIIENMIKKNARLLTIYKYLFKSTIFGEDIIINLILETALRLNKPYNKKNLNYLFRKADLKDYTKKQYYKHLIFG